jgi:hypothetical protein
LLRFELSDRRRDFGWCKHCRRHLIEKWLKDVMIAAIDQHDLGFATLQCTRRCNACKAATNDDYALTVRWRCFRARQRLA